MRYRSNRRRCLCGKIYRVRFCRIDADVAAALTREETTETASEATQNTLAELFRRVSANDTLEIKFATLKDGSLPAMLTVSEESRRMEEMMRMYALQSGMDAPAPYPTTYTLTVNLSSPLTARLSALCDTDPALAEVMAAQVWRLSLLSQRKLTAEELKTFLAESFDLLGRL